MLAWAAMEPGPELRDALSALGVQRLVLAIHDVSFPSTPAEDIGRGSPYSDGARAFLSFVRELGFDGVQLGPQGQGSPGNLSPYDGSVFSKSVLSLPLRALTFDSLVAPSFVEAEVAKTPSGDLPRPSFPCIQGDEGGSPPRSAAAALACRAGRRGRSSARAGHRVVRCRTPVADPRCPLRGFVSLYGTDDTRTWPAGNRRPTAARIAEVTAGKRDVVDAWKLGQRLLAAEHESLRAHLATVKMRIYGDLQVGLSLRDRWMRDGLFLDGYALGAPPSRTNPDGQPWGYRVFDPHLYQRRFVPAGSEGPVTAFFRARVEKLWDEFDGVRIDHPHGLVCPWVYDARATDSLAAVAAGARLFETPTMPGGPSGFDDLAALAIARPDQIDVTVPAFDDDRVHELDAEQVDEYSALFDLVVASVRARGAR